MNSPQSILLEGDALSVLKTLPNESVQSIITSPPYWGMRNYEYQGQIGLESTIDEYIFALQRVFSEANRVLKNDGTLWVNIGDTYTSGNRGYRAADKKSSARKMAFRPDNPEGLKNKDLIGIPWRVAFALQEIGWFLRSEIIWNKPNAMPESVKDRPTRAHEHIFLLSKSEKYYYDHESVKEVGNNGKLRNRRTVWSIPTESSSNLHPAIFPEGLVVPCVLASSKPRDLIMDPFSGISTVGVVCEKMNRNYVGIELNPKYIKLAKSSLNKGSKNPISNSQFFSTEKEYSP